MTTVLVEESQYRRAFLAHAKFLRERMELAGCAP